MNLLNANHFQVNFEEHRLIKDVIVPTVQIFESQMKIHKIAVQVVCCTKFDPVLRLDKLRI